MKKLLIALSAVMLVMTSCQKEASLEDPNSTPGGGGGNNAQGLLTRMALVAGADSTVLEYGYDAAKRLQVFRTSNTDPDADVYKRIVRNSAGIITQFSTIDGFVRSFGLDSVISNVAYNAAQGRYSYSLSTINESGVTYKDSTAYIYDGAGNLTQKAAFWKVGPTDYEMYQRSEYTYGAGNLLSERYFSDDGNGNLELAFTYNYSYDAKTNPLKLGPESIIVLGEATFFGDGIYFGNNNVSVLNLVDGTNPSNSTSLAFTYNYNTANKPIAGTVTQTPGGGSLNIRYYYN